MSDGWAARYREQSMRRAWERTGVPFREESLRQAVARKEEIIRQLLDDVESLRRAEARQAASFSDLVRALPRPAPVVLAADEVPGLMSYAEIKAAMQLPLHQITSRREAEGLHGLPLADLPDEVADFVRKVAALMEVKPESQWLFVKGHEHEGLPEGAYCLISEGTHASPFTWWLDMAVLNGFVGEPAGWRVRATDSPAVVGIFPV